MNEHDDTVEDLPAEIAAALRDVTTTGERERDAHIDAALAEIAVAHGTVVPLRTRYLPRAAAAAVVLLLGAGIGWSVRGSNTTTLAGEAGTDTAVPRNATNETTPDTDVPKGSTQASGSATMTGSSATCDLSGIAGTQWLTNISSTGKRYAIFVTDSSVVWYDLDTCEKVQDIAHPVTTTP